MPNSSSASIALARFLLLAVSRPLNRSCPERLCLGFGADEATEEDDEEVDKANGADGADLADGADEADEVRTGGAGRKKLSIDLILRVLLIPYR